ncbi:MAG: hypothetical protein AB1505_37090, partial [Candidatus Latescibacterota bacterium]
DWSPPKLVLTSYRKDGKVAELDMIEAAVFLGRPFSQILSAMLAVLQYKRAVSLGEDGRIEVVDRSARLNEHERQLLACVQPDGTLDQPEVRHFLHQVVEAVQRKSWDADIEATRAHYEARYEETCRRLEAEGAVPGKSGPDQPRAARTAADSYYPYWLYIHHGHAGRGGAGAGAGAGRGVAP